MRHEAAYERNASLLEDLGIGVAVTAMTAAVVVGSGLWFHYVNGSVFILATAILAWHSGFRPALVSTIVSTAALGPLVRLLDANASLVNMPVRSHRWRSSRWSCRGCAATCTARASVC